MATSIFTSALLSSLAKSLVDKSFSVASIQTNKIIKSLTNKKIATDYYNKAINKVFVFRTLTHGDKNVYLDEIYYPLRIAHPTKGGVVIGDEVQLDSDNTCIVGLAGQGKTTIMRKLFLEEIVRKKRMPFFITLRQISDFENLEVNTLLLEHLNSNGIKCDIDDVNHLCKTKLVTIYFDGFDEIPPLHREYALKFLNEVFFKFNCRTVVTSRPDTEITREPGYEIYNVGFLEEDEIYDILDQRIQNKEAKKQLTHILKGKDFLLESIKTPILFDIFIVTSASIKDDPNSISDYYDGLFTALIYRHDLIKNLNRKKKSNLSDKELEGVFSLFSFLSLMNNKSDFSRTELINVFDTCLKIKQSVDSAVDVMEDILDGTNIIVRDGYDNFVYIHKSIQEYFAAKCISIMDDNSKKKTLHNLSEFSKTRTSITNTNLILMLSYLDSFSFVKHFIIPILNRESCFENETCKEIDKHLLEKCIDNWIVGLSDEEFSCRYINPLPTTELMGKIRSIDNINLILEGGNRSGVMDNATTTILFYDSELIAKVATKHVNFNQEDIPLDIRESLVGHFNKANQTNTRFFRLKSIKAHYVNYNKLIDTLFEDSQQSVTKINNYIRKNYLEKISSDKLLSDIIKNISFK